MALAPNTKKTIKYGNETFVLPVRLSGWYVDDARGFTICEVKDLSVGKELVKYFNSLGNK